MRVSSEAVPITWTGRVWGTSARSAPRVITIGAPTRWATVAIWSVKVRQRSAGSGPRIMTTSVPGSDADQTPTVGQMMLRLPFSSRRSRGRTVAKSVKGSGSISARGSAPLVSMRVLSAAEAASPASFQPVNAASTTGFLSAGGRCQRRCSTSGSMWVRGYRWVLVGVAGGGGGSGYGRLMAVEVSAVTVVDDDLVAAFARLIP